MSTENQTPAQQLPADVKLKHVEPSVYFVLREFIAALAENLQGIGDLVVKQIALHGYSETQQDFARMRLGITRHYFNRLVQIGHHQMLPQLFAPDNPGERALAKCPMELQSEYVSNRVELAVGDGDSLFVKISDLTPSQAKQLFDYDTIRDLPAQRAWLLSQQRQAPSEDIASHVTYRNGKIKFSGHCEFTPADLKRIAEKYL